jgi:hypothetical protein
MSLNKSVSQRLKWARVALFVCSASLGLVAAIATTSGCEQKQEVSNTPPAADADMKKVIINVYGMT